MPKKRPRNETPRHFIQGAYSLAAARVLAEQPSATRTARVHEVVTKHPAAMSVLVVLPGNVPTAHVRSVSDVALVGMHTSQPHIAAAMKRDIASRVHSAVDVLMFPIQAGDLLIPADTTLRRALRPVIDLKALLPRRVLPPQCPVGETDAFFCFPLLPLVQARHKTRVVRREVGGRVLDIPLLEMVFENFHLLTGFHMPTCATGVFLTQYKPDGACIDPEAVERVVARMMARGAMPVWYLPYIVAVLAFETVVTYSSPTVQRVVERVFQSVEYSLQCMLDVATTVSKAPRMSATIGATQRAVRAERVRWSDRVASVTATEPARPSLFKNASSLAHGLGASSMIAEIMQRLHALEEWQEAQTVRAERDTTQEEIAQIHEKVDAIGVLATAMLGHVRPENE